MNIDTKLHHKILVNRIQQQLKKMTYHNQVRIHPKLTRMVHHMQTSVIHHINKRNVENYTIISIDTEKTFEKI